MKNLSHSSGTNKNMCDSRKREKDRKGKKRGEHGLVWARALNSMLECLSSKFHNTFHSQNYCLYIYCMKHFDIFDNHLNKFVFIFLQKNIICFN